MPTYAFQARDAHGKAQAGRRVGATPAAVAAELRGQSLVVLDVRELSSGGASAAGAGPESAPFFSLPPASFDVELGLLQSASMLRSGLTLLLALKGAAEQSRRPKMAVIWRRVHDRIEEGAAFSQALSEFPRVFDAYTVQLARVGEQSGTLDRALTRAAEKLERDRALRTTLLTSLMYPAIVLVSAIAVAAFMVLSVIPKLQKFLVGFGRRLPAITQLLIDISSWLQAWLPYLSLAALTALVALAIVYRWPPGRLFLDRLVLRVPILGTIFRLSGTAVFARGLGTLVESGITQLEGLRTVEGLLGNRALARRVGVARRAVLEGGNLSAPLAERGLFMPMLPRMVAVGEATGTLDKVLEEVASFHEKQLAALVRRMSVLIEPLIIVLVGGIVGFVYIAFFVAIFSLAGG